MITSRQPPTLTGCPGEKATGKRPSSVSMERRSLAVVYLAWHLYNRVCRAYKHIFPQGLIRSSLLCICRTARVTHTGLLHQPHDSALCPTTNAQPLMVWRLQLGLPSRQGTLLIQVRMTGESVPRFRMFLGVLCCKRVC